MDVRLIIDLDVCVGYGECVAEDPDAMELGDSGQSRARLATLDAARAARICASCPVGAITTAPAAAVSSGQLKHTVNVAASASLAGRRKVRPS